MLIAAVLEVIGVAAIPAFVSAVVDPDRLRAAPWAGDMLDNLGLQSTERLVLWGAVALALIFSVKTAFVVFNYGVQMRFIINRRVDLTRRLVTAYLSAPHTFHLKTNSAVLIRNVERETTAICNQVMGASLEVATKLLMLVAVLVFLLIAEPIVTLVWLGVFGAIAGYIVVTLGQKLKRYGLREQSERGLVMQALHQALGGVRETRVLGRERFFADRVDRSIRSMAHVMEFKQALGKAIPPVTELTAIAGLLVLAVALVLLDRPTDSILVTLSLFVVGLVRLKETMGSVMTHMANLRYHLVAVDPVHDDLMALEKDGAPQRLPPPPKVALQVEREIAFDDVWYAYEDAKRHSLQGVSLNIPKGAAIGFVGATGAGKSTLVDVMLGLLEPQRGAVRVDGVDVRESGVRSWQAAIGYVPQSIYLIDDTIRRNIALGLEDDQIDEAALTAALRTAQLEDLIAKLPLGLDTPVGEDGARLSGGERQRIGIARALYHDPAVLILDEATSALDNATERAIIQAVEVLKGSRTVIMIAHRLSTVRNCDRLYFLKEGRIEAAGSFTDLQREHSDFADMAAA